MNKFILFSALSLGIFASANADDSDLIAWGKKETRCEKKETSNANCCPKPKEEPVCCETTNPSYVYISFRPGVNFLHASEKDEIELEPKVGYSLGAALGYRWRETLEAEFEFTYRYNGVCNVEFLEHHVKACGSVKSFSYMANLLYLIPYTFGKCCTTPYIGGGIGYVDQNANACPYTLPDHGKKGGFGWQVIGGFQQKIFKHIEMSVDYRFNKGPLHYLYNQTLQFGFTYLF